MVRPERKLSGMQNDFLDFYKYCFLGATDVQGGVRGGGGGGVVGEWTPSFPEVFLFKVSKGQFIHPPQQLIYQLCVHHFFLC